MKLKTRFKWFLKKINHKKRKEKYDVICYHRCHNWIKFLEDYIRYNLPLGVDYIEEYYDYMIDRLLYPKIDLYTFNKPRHRNMLVYFSDVVKRLKMDVDNVKNNINVVFPLNRTSVPIDITTTKFVQVYNAFKRLYIGYIMNKFGNNTYVGIFMDDATGKITDFSTIDETYLIKPLYEEYQIN